MSDEKLKMKRGEWYDANFDPGLLNERLEVKDLCAKFNQLLPSEIEKQRVLLKKILPNVDVEKVSILAPFMVDYGYNIFMGRGSFLNHNCYLMDCAEIRFGEDCYIGPDCGFYTAIHPLDRERRLAGLEKALPIKIGNAVWLGGGVKILPGVTIGDGAVIGAGSVVTKDIPADSVAVGNPARVSKKILADSTI